MASPEDCPGPKRLDAWLSGTLPDDEQAEALARTAGQVWSLTLVWSKSTKTASAQLTHTPAAATPRGAN